MISRLGMPYWPWYGPTIGVKPFGPNVRTAAYITRAALEPSCGATLAGNGVVLMTPLCSLTQAWKKIRYWPATREPVTSALPGPHRPSVLELSSKVDPPLLGHDQMCRDL